MHLNASKVNVFLGIVVIFCVAMFVQRGSYVCRSVPEPVHSIPLYLKETTGESTDATSRNLQKTLKDERDRLSMALNMMKKKQGQENCERDVNAKALEAGGWCKSVSREDGGEHATDMPLVQELSKFFKRKRVGSFGDGPGAYKRELLKLNDVTAYDAYDGAPFCEETSEGRVKFMDLTIPQYGIPIYDWVMSLEVAEHIPKQYEPVYMDNLARHCREGIVMSWAIPDQSGLAHINNRPLTYVIDLLDKYGFRHDKDASKMLQNAATLFWLRNNTNVFRRKDTHYVDILENWYT